MRRLAYKKGLADLLGAQVGRLLDRTMESNGFERIHVKRNEKSKFERVKNGKKIGAH